MALMSVTCKGKIFDVQYSYVPAGPEEPAGVEIEHIFISQLNTNKDFYMIFTEDDLYDMEQQILQALKELKADAEVDEYIERKHLEQGE